MTKLSSVSLVTATLLAAASLPAQGPGGHGLHGHGQHPRVDHFRPLASFNLPSGIAEILDVADDGKLLIVSNASAQQLDFLDITDPRNPTQVASLNVTGEPTSVSVAGDYAFVNVWVELPQQGQPAPQFLPGNLVVIDLHNPHSPSIVGAIDIGYHPDSCKAKLVNGEHVVVCAIENQPVVVVGGLVTDGEDPNDPNDVSPAGLIQVVRVDVNNLANSQVLDVALPAATLAAAGCLFPADPQSEFVAWHDDTVAVSLQENNGVAIVDMSDPASPSLVRVFSCGVASDRPADLNEDDDIALVDTYPADAPTPTDAQGNPIAAGSRFPDALCFSPDGTRIFTADEGEMDFTGGRGFSWHSLDGSWHADDNGLVERTAVVFSHYPEGRSENKGVEIEGCTAARFPGGNDFLFMSSERGSFVTVWKLDAQNDPHLVQLLPTGISPEGIVAIPARRLLVTADEVSGTVTIFRGATGQYRPDPRAPQLLAADFETPWAALSGMCRGDLPFRFYAVPDNALPSCIYSLRVGNGFVPVRKVTPVTIGGVQQRYDFEGVARDHSVVRPAAAGWWCASEGNGSTKPNLLVQVARDGEVVRELQLPFAIDAGANPALGGNAPASANGGKIRSNGFEGVCLSPNGRWLYAAIQRDFVGESPTGPKFARIARYDLQQIQNGTAPHSGLRWGGDWEFFFYEFDSNDTVNWAGLSEITCLGNHRLLVIERDKGIGAGSTLKKLYKFSLLGVAADTDGQADLSDTVSKFQVRDVVEDFSPYEKIEGIGLGWFGDLWVALDNDGGEVEPRLRFFGWL